MCPHHISICWMHISMYYTVPTYFQEIGQYKHLCIFCGLQWLFYLAKAKPLARQQLLKQSFVSGHRPMQCNECRTKLLRWSITSMYILTYYVNVYTRILHNAHADKLHTSTYINVYPDAYAYANVCQCICWRITSMYTLPYCANIQTDVHYHIH